MFFFKEKNWNDIKLKSTELLSFSSFHGIPNIIHTKRNRIKVIWWLFLLASISTCSYLVTQSVLNYFKFDVITKIRHIKDQPTLFPRVSICNSNMFTTNYADEFIKKKLEDYGIGDIYNSSVLENLFPSDTRNSFFNKLEFSKYLVKSYAKSQRTSDEERRKLGYDIKDILISCKFNGNECSEEDFVWSYDFYYGNCFDFNSGLDKNGKQIDLKLSTKSGRIDGLQIELFVGVPQNLDLFTFNSGAILIINNQSYNQLEENGVYVAAGYETDIIIERVFSTHLKKPFGECDLEETKIGSYHSFVFNEVIRNNITYSQIDCFDFCYQLQTIEKCNCSDVAQPTLLNAKECLTIDEVFCLYEVYEEFTKTDSRGKCDCPLECSVFGLTFSTSSLDFPSDYYGNLLLQTDKLKSKFNSANVSLEELRKNILKVNIYYTDLKYKMLSEYQSITVVSLLSDIGGKIRFDRPNRNFNLRLKFLRNLGSVYWHLSAQFYRIPRGFH
jgi:hypothetical protein